MPHDELVASCRTVCLSSVSLLSTPDRSTRADAAMSAARARADDDDVEVFVHERS